jgi:prevent-host-death family protein
VLVVMHVVGSRELRPRLGEYLARAKDGDEVVVLVHGQPAALLRPVRPDDAGALVPSRLVRDELHEAIRKARAKSLVVTWHGRMFAVLQAPPEGLEVWEDAS